jgi:hypothetical protein
MASESFEVRFRKGSTWTLWQTVSFGTEATQQAAVDLINTQIEGGEARINGANIDLYSDGWGTASRVETQNVDAGVTTKLGIPDASSADGTGDVAEITAITFAEFKATVEADVADILVTLDEVTGGARCTSATSNTGSSSSIQTPLAEPARLAAGFDAAVHDGDDTDASSGMTASYTKTSKIDAGKRAVHNIVVSDNDEVSVRFAANASRSLVNLDVRAAGLSR